MVTQQDLPLPAPTPSGSIVINARGCGRRAGYVLIPQHYLGEWYNTADQESVEHARDQAAQRAAAFLLQIAGANHQRAIINGLQHR